MNKTIAIVGILAAVGAAWTATSWYTGVRTERYWETRIREANQQLAKNAVAGVSVGLDSYDRGIFSSTARYTLTVPLGQSKDGTPANVDLKLVDHIQHGPFPPTRLASGHFAPVMLAAQGELMHDGVTAKWFTTAGDKAPVAVDMVMSYGHEIDGTLTVLPIDFSSDKGYRLKFSGTTLRMGGNADTGPHTLAGRVDQLLFERRDLHGIAEQLEIHGFHIDADLQPDWEQLQVGKLNVLAEVLNIVADHHKPITLTDLSGHIDSGHTDGKYHVHTTNRVGMVSIDGKDIAGGNLIFNADSLDPAALGELIDVNNRVMDRQKSHRPGDDNASLGPTPAEVERVKQALHELLAGNASLAIDPFLVESDGGVSLLEFKLDLAAPSASNPLLAHTILQSIRKLDLRIQVCKPQAAALLSSFLVNKSGDAAAALSAAKDQVETYSRLAQTSGAKVEDDNVIITFVLADNKVNFNGRELPVEDFVQSLITKMPSNPRGTESE